MCSCTATGLRRAVPASGAPRDAGCPAPRRRRRRARLLARALAPPRAAPQARGRRSGGDGRARHLQAGWQGRARGHAVRPCRQHGPRLEQPGDAAWAAPAPCAPARTTAQHHLRPCLHGRPTSPVPLLCPALAQSPEPCPRSHSRRSDAPGPAPRREFEAGSRPASSARAAPRRAACRAGLQTWARAVPRPLQGGKAETVLQATQGLLTNVRGRRTGGAVAGCRRRGMPAQGTAPASAACRHPRLRPPALPVPCAAVRRHAAASDEGPFDPAQTGARPGCSESRPALARARSVRRQHAALSICGAISCAQGGAVAAGCCGCVLEDTHGLSTAVGPSQQTPALRALLSTLQRAQDLIDQSSRALQAELERKAVSTGRWLCEALGLVWG